MPKRDSHKNCVSGLVAFYEGREPEELRLQKLDESLRHIFDGPAVCDDCTLELHRIQRRQRKFKQVSQRNLPKEPVSLPEPVEVESEV